MKKYMYYFVLAFSLISMSAWAEDQKIDIKDHQFLPDKVTVAVGTKVTWINHDQDPHTVIGRDNTFHSGALDTEESYSFTFSKPGTYKYFCSLHPAMQGTISVIGKDK